MKKTQPAPTPTEKEVKYRYDQPVRWSIGGKHADFTWLLWLPFLGWLLSFWFSRPTVTSPLISSLLDLLDPKARWAIPAIENTTVSYWGGLLFILGFLLILRQVYFGLDRSEVETEEINSFDRGRTIERFVRRIPLVGLFPGKAKNDGLSRLGAQIIFWAALLSNLALYFIFWKLIDNPDLKLDTPFFYALYTVAILSRLAALFVGASKLLQYIFHDFGLRITRFLGNYLRYFYPTIFLVGIVSFVLSKLDQFDAFFIELVQSPANFLLFAIFLFPTSIILIWFAPSYLFFTDQNYAHRKNSWHDLRWVVGHGRTRKDRNRVFDWLYKHKRLIGLSEDPVLRKEPPASFAPFDVKEVSHATESFFRVSTLLGILYISTLVGICVSIYFGNRTGGEIWSVLLPPLVLLLSLAYWGRTKLGLHRALQSPDPKNPPVVTQRRVSREAPPKNWMASLFFLLSDRNKKTEQRTVYFVRERWPFYFGLGMIALAFLFFAAAVVTSFLGADWEMSFGLFLGFLICSLFTFPWLAVYRRFYYLFSFEPRLEKEEELQRLRSSRQMRFWDHWMDRLDHLSVQAMLGFNLAVALVFVVVFILGLFGVLYSSTIEWLNPLNLYLIMSSGFVAFIMLVDRYLRISEYLAQYLVSIRPNAPEKAMFDRISKRHLFWGTLVVAIGLAYAYYGNSYHEIPYRAESRADPAYSLDRYARAFVERLPPGDSTSPILFIGADGGGLKACYWTMLNLYRLDSMGLYDRNVFMVSGASGGNVGLSMYTLLKAQGKDAMIPEIIRKIGRTNFLSGDLIGWLTRFSANYLPNLPSLSPNGLEDRAESMARAYLDIVGEPSGPFSYDDLRIDPYWRIWTERDYRLPLFFANATRAEDGMRSIVHPLDEPLLGEGRLDLTRRSGGEAISFPDAAFLSNRFPIMSPVARIPGKGHFVDAGNSDNSGLSGILHLLRLMKSRSLDTTETGRFYQEEVFSRPIVILGLRNVLSRFVRDEFYADRRRLNRGFYQSELGGHSQAGLNSGISGVPNELDDYLRSGVPKALGLMDTFMVLDLPFPLTATSVQYALYGELADTSLTTRVEAINRKIVRTMGCDPEGKNCFMVAPPLGRLMAQPSLEYMERMLEYPDNQAVMRRLGRMK